MTTLDLTSEQYHADPRMSRSKLKEFADDPQLFYQRHIEKTAKPIEPTPAMLWGLDVESMYFGNTLHNVAEVPQDLLTDTGRIPSNGPKRQPYLDWVAANANCRVMKTPEKLARVKEVRKATEQLSKCPKANALLQGDYHKKLGFTYREIEWRCEFDVLNLDAQLLKFAGLDLPDGCIVDLKTAAKNDSKSFAAACVDRWYHVQAWMYQFAWYLEADITLPVIFVVQHNSPSYSVEIYCPSQEMMDMGEQVADLAMDDYLACLETDDWRKPTHNEVIDLEPPKWAHYAQERIAT